MESTGCTLVIKHGVTWNISSAKIIELLLGCPAMELITRCYTTYRWCSWPNHWAYQSQSFISGSSIFSKLEFMIACLLAGWWFGTFFIFPYIGNNNPIWRIIIFQRGRYTTNQIIWWIMNLSIYQTRNQILKQYMFLLYNMCQYGDFHKWGDPPKWLVCNGKSI